MPYEFSVSCNPLLKSFNGTPLCGYYLYDDCGVKGRKVACIENGFMKDFLTCRTHNSIGNGHGRAAFGKEIQPRQSNLVVETSRTYTESQLRSMLIEELGRLGMEYGYYIKTVNNGWTVDGSDKTASAFNIVPVESYKVYTDGRPDELVRGVSLIGTPLSVLSNIKAGGGHVEVFNGKCGAMSGWIPVACVSPMLYVSQMETQCTHSKHEDPEFHYFLQCHNNKTHDADSVIFQAMSDEISMHSESVSEGIHPLFIDYHIRRQATTHITSSLGTCFRFESEAVKNSGLVHVIAGNRMQTSYSQKNMGKPFTLPDEISYCHIRRKLGKRTESQFRDALLWWKRNKAELANGSLSEWLEMPGKTIIQKSALNHWQEDAQWLKILADTLSAVIGKHHELSASRVEIEQEYVDFYRVTSEGLKTKTPSKEIKINVFADMPLSSHGTIIKRRDSYTAYDVADLPPVDTLMSFVERFAQLVIAQGMAECTEDREYIGPVLYENDAAMSALFDEYSLNDNLSKYIHSWFKLSSREYDNSYTNIGKKVISSSISLYQSGSDSLYDGHRLLRYSLYDADGIRPQAVELVRDGILLKQLTGRTPTPITLASTGNECLTKKWVSNR